MKLRMLMMALMVGLCVCAQRHAMDTTFLLRENGALYHAVYIEPNGQSVYYKQLQNSINSNFDAPFYADGIQVLADAGIKFIKCKIEFPRQWSPLYIYKNKYYAYSPSDGMYNTWVKMSDSTVLFYAGGEMLVSAIENVTKKSKSNYQLKSKGPNKQNEIINIYIIDQQQQIAVFEYPNRVENKYELRVSTQRLTNFPLVVNYCPEQKQPEFEFDQPNFDKLLQNAK